LNKHVKDSYQTICEEWSLDDLLEAHDALDALHNIEIQQAREARENG